jgi:hypothetical protein
MKVGHSEGMKQTSEGGRFRDPGVGVPQIWGGLTWFESDPDFAVKIVEKADQVVGLKESLKESL